MYIYNWLYKIYKNGYFPSILSKAINRTLNLHDHTLIPMHFSLISMTFQYSSRQNHLLVQSWSYSTQFQREVLCNQMFIVEDDHHIHFKFNFEIGGFKGWACE